MTMIDVDTSPLQAAREWRGVGLVAVAMNCGLPVTQAEALEAGDSSAFDSVDEMLAAAVLYGASLGIGRDEAMALLDRTVGREAAIVNFPTVVSSDVHDQRPNGAFSGAVQGRSARIAERDDIVATPAIVVDDDEPLAPAAIERELPAVPTGPTPEQAIAASGELHLDDAFGPDAPWERSGGTGELEAWVEDFEDYADEDAVRTMREPGTGVFARIGGGMHAGLERVIGTDRADAAANKLRGVGSRSATMVRSGRERLGRSEHATLFVAIGAGAILIAIVVALGGALGGGNDEGFGPVAKPKASEASTTSAGAAKTDGSNKSAKADEKSATAASAAPLAPARITVDVYNAGSQKGEAKDIAAKLEAAGYRIGDVTNAKGDYSGATIIHPAGMTREARQLARRTGITTLQVAPGSTTHMTVIVA